MNERKQKVIKKAHQLFIDKGYYNTSINDILEYSSISKGTFYNYFSSKNELLMEIFKTTYKEVAKKRDELLIGKDPADQDIFIKQMELHIEMNRTYKLNFLFDEILASHDEELLHFIKKSQFMFLKWLYNRFIELFGENKKSILLDCAIMFTGILNQNIRYYSMSSDAMEDIATQDVIRYSVNRIKRIVEEVEVSQEQLFSPDMLERWLPEAKNNNIHFQQNLYRTVLSIKKALNNNEDHSKDLELINFIYEELLNEEEPRYFLINLALQDIKKSSKIESILISELESLVEDYIKA